MADNHAHYFLGIPLPQTIKKCLSQWSASMQSIVHYKYWTHINDYHVTLFFLGSVGDKQIEELSDHIDRRVTAIQPFSMQLAEPGTFGSSQRPRVLWAGVNSNERLFALHRLINHICSEAGFEPEKRPYQPHITLAKKWGAREGIDINNIFEVPLKACNITEWLVSEVALFKVQPQSEPRYQKVKAFQLGE